MATFLRPHFVDRRDWDDLRAASDRLLGIATRVARSVFGGDPTRLCEFLGMPEGERKLVELDPGGPDVLLSRADGFLTPDGPCFVEINSDAPAGFGYGDRMAAVFESLPLFQQFSGTRRVRYVPSGKSLLDAVLDAFWARGGTGLPRVAILDWADVKTRADQAILKSVFDARGVPCALLDPREVEIRAGKLWGAGEVIDLVYRRALLPELVARQEEVAPFLRAYREGLVVVVNSFRCALSEDKGFFAILTDETHEELLQEGERAFLRSVLPWTRKLEERTTTRRGQEVDLVRHVLAHKDEFVVKPSHSFGGTAVVVGDEASASEWEAAVLKGLEEPMVVQERVSIPEEVFPVFDSGRLEFEPRKLNVNPFYVRGAAVGAVARASRTSVINVSAGGGSIPSFVAD